MLPVLLVVLSSLPAPFDSLVPTEVHGHQVFTRPKALRLMKGCNPTETPCD